MFVVTLQQKRKQKHNHMKYYYTMEYLPVRYDGTSQQIANRKAVWNFKDGNASSDIINELAADVNKIAGCNKSNYVICFVPASTSWKTARRYSEVARRLQSMTGVTATLSAITKPQDGEAGHIAGKTVDPAAEFSFSSEYFRGKNVILVDDVITRGRTLSSTGNRLLSKGASSVIGLVVAKTINPNWAA